MPDLFFYKFKICVYFQKNMHHGRCMVWDCHHGVGIKGTTIIDRVLSHFLKTFETVRRLIFPGLGICMGGGDASLVDNGLPEAHDGARAGGFMKRSLLLKPNI